jgi:lipopolysaccharide export system protein LptA
MLPVFAASFIFVAGNVSAQGLSFFQSTKGSEKKRTGKTPTVINADSMDIDIAKNIAVFTGNVKVDDEEMGISCKKMTIYLEDKKADDAANASAVKPAPSKTDDSNPEESKQVSRIICEENVVIIRKSLSETEKGQGEQKATSGHADYDVKTGKIVLTKNNPALRRGGDTLKGDPITIWRDSERVSVEQGEIKMNPNLPESADDTEKAKDNKTEDKK